MVVSPTNPSSFITQPDNKYTKNSVNLVISLPNNQVKTLFIGDSTFFLADSTVLYFCASFLLGVIKIFDFYPRKKPINH